MVRGSNERARSEGQTSVRGALERRRGGEGARGERREREGHMVGGADRDCMSSTVVDEACG